MKLTSHLLDAFLTCPMKCFLRSTGHPGSGNAYAEWMRSRYDAYLQKAAKCLLAGLAPEDIVISPPGTESLRTARWRLALDWRLQVGDMEAQLCAVERVPAEGRGRQTGVIPIRFTPFNKLTNHDRQMLAFDAVLLSANLGHNVTVGRMVHGASFAVVSVKLPHWLAETRKRIEKLSSFLAVPTAPTGVLNRHCAECEFQGHCRQNAIEKDDLSLLAGMSDKERKKLNDKGLFTIRQLSHTFRPRRHRKRPHEKAPKYQHPLKALAIREKKTLIVGGFNLTIEGTPVFLDVEGLPDNDFYYLIGLRIKTPDGYSQHSLWADVRADERRIWKQFLGLVADISKPVLIHYGNYEKAFFKRMCERYGSPPKESVPAKAITASVNLLSVLFAHVYFPTYSNSLKEIASLLGANWESSNASGLTTIAWRNTWESTPDTATKDKLIAYNRDDCVAVSILMEYLLKLAANPQSCADVGLPDEQKPTTSERSAEAHRVFKQMLDSAHWDYSKARIRLSSPKESQKPEPIKRTPRHRKVRKLPPIKGRVVRLPRKRKCQRHLDRPTLLRAAKRKVTEHALIDIAFSRFGCKKTIVRYVGKDGWCPYCHGTFPAPGVKRVRYQVYDRGVYVWVAYLRVALRLSYRLICKATAELFDEPLTTTSAEAIIKRMSERSKETEELLLERILQSPAVHVDETRLSIVGVQQYVWVLTDGKRAVFRLTEGRETDFLQPLFSGYKGTLVSDFYGGYDAMPCRQQKCLVHLIGDLNDDLWKRPFDVEFEDFAVAVRDLLLPIMEDVNRFGLKTYHLQKHEARVVDFYRRCIDREQSEHEFVAKYQKRFGRFKDSLFTFLHYDNVPWNNNSAERALRHLAVQRKISGAFTSKGAGHYLRLLGVAQSCLFQGKSFLGFLLSGIIDVDAYKVNHRTTIPPGTFFDAEY